MVRSSMMVTGAVNEPARSSIALALPARAASASVILKRLPSWDGCLPHWSLHCLACCCPLYRDCTRCTQLPLAYRCYDIENSNVSYHQESRGNVLLLRCPSSPMPLRASIICSPLRTALRATTTRLPSVSFSVWVLRVALSYTKIER